MTHVMSKHNRILTCAKKTRLLFEIYIAQIPQSLVVKTNFIRSEEKKTVYQYPSIFLNYN